MAKPKGSIETNMRIWDVLGKTDPGQTKQFTRSGGFRGTAIKPMWSNQRMTQQFGPCGLGWGSNRPEFQIVPAGEEVMVYCTVGMWYIDPSSALNNIVYGVGGDKVVAKGKDGLRTDDEAFKKAYTDALSNAMKFIGVGADVHMGLFDDSKYVQSVREEFTAEQKAQEDAVRQEVDRQREAAKGMTLVSTITQPPPELEWGYNKASGVLICRILDAKQMQKKDSKADFVCLQINGKVEGSKKDKVYYWHATHRDLLLNSIGKIAKLIVTEKGDFPNVTEVLEVDGIKVEKPVDASTELKARTAGSILGLTDRELLTVLKMSGGDWQVTLDRINEQIKEQKEQEPA